MLDAYSCAIRWNTRSAPVRSICALMPGYFASKALANVFRYLDIGGRVEDNLAFLPGRLNEFGCY